MMPPAVACSPPTTRSTALPIGSRSAASRLSVAARVGSSDGGVGVGVAASFEAQCAAPASLSRPPARFSFSSTYTPRSQSIASIAAAGAARPPSAPPAVKPPQQLLVGFDAPAAAGGAAPAPHHEPPAAGPLSPTGGRRETKPSLLSMALSDLPLASSLSLGSELPTVASGLPMVRARAHARASRGGGDCAVFSGGQPLSQHREAARKLHARCDPSRAGLAMPLSPAASPAAATPPSLRPPPACLGPTPRRGRHGAPQRARPDPPRP
jgi:hypothetical protein